jgi:hypothetical protein
VKKADRHASAHHSTDPRRARSAHSGRTLPQVAAGSAPGRP